jgi:alkanesulfonate monooxygenase SsuD/methylene tetrahydromethanopterin reductase-like flavin-dependent oxidoreductase (luciferase family)
MALSFGIKTNPVHTGYDDILRVWEEADEVPEIGHAWLWDHFRPLYGPADGPIHEGWTLLAALAARTSRLRLGLMVTSNRVRPPAVLAKIAATTDVISRGRLVVGLGVGGTRQPPGAGANPAEAEFAAYGLDLVSPAEGVARLDEACTILRRMWTGEEFDFTGRHYRLTGAQCRPVPVQRPGPPLLIGGWGDRTLRVVARHADIWNVPGPPHNTAGYLAERARVLDAHCATAGRDPATITRSTQTHVDYDDPAATRAVVRELAAAGVTHIVLNLRTPYPPGVARWLASEIIAPSTGV